MAQGDAPAQDSMLRHMLKMMRKWTGSKKPRVGGEKRERQRLTGKKGMVAIAVSVEDVLRRHAATSRCRFVASRAASVASRLLLLASRPAPLRVRSGGSDTGNGFGRGCGLQECYQIGFVPNPARTKCQFSHGPGLESSCGVPHFHLDSA
jgi:hypothetical protein